MATLLQDTFSATPGTSLVSGGYTMTVGPGWSFFVSVGTLTGTTQTTGSFDYARMVSSAVGDFCAVSDAGSADGVISTTAMYINTTNANAGICFRFTDVNNFWLAHIDLAAQAMQIFEKSGGSFTQRASASFAGAISTPYALSVTLSGASISFSVNGGAPITYGSAATGLSATKHGFYIGGETSGATVDYEGFLMTGTVGGGIFPYWLHASQRVIGGPE